MKMKNRHPGRKCAHFEECGNMAAMTFKRTEAEKLQGLSEKIRLCEPCGELYAICNYCDGAGILGADVHLHNLSGLLYCHACMPGRKSGQWTIGISVSMPMQESGVEISVSAKPKAGNQKP